MASWAEVSKEAPEFAARAQAAFERNKHMTIATVRRDGSPRISGTELRFENGEVSFGMMARSRKALDLLRDPRLAIHGPTADPPDEPREWVGESKLAGRAIEVPNDDPDDDSHSFRIDVHEVVFTHINDAGDRLVIESWHPGRAIEVVDASSVTRALIRYVAGDGVARYRTGVYDSNRWQRFSPRPGDIVISTPEKSGTTWMQMICALLVFQRTTFDRSLDLISPWLDMQIREIGDVISDLEAQSNRRFVKTHTPLDGLPIDPRLTYICVGRDPRDVGISWIHHSDNLDVQALFSARDRAIGNEDLAELYRDREPAPTDPLERFWRWVDDTPEAGVTRVGLASTMHHLDTFWQAREQPNIILVHYEDLQSDLEGEMRRFAHRLTIDIDEARFPELVAAAGFQAMRDRADEIAPDASFGILRDNRAFFRRGGNGQWKELLDEAGRIRYAERVRQLAPRDLIEWVHREPVEGVAGR